VQGADHGDGAQQRDGIQLHGGGDERGRHGCRVRALEQRDAADCADAPIIGTADTGNGEATVSFVPPAFDGGSAILSYTVTSNPTRTATVQGARSR